MRRLRQFVRTQTRGGLLAVYVAYSLAIQATMASIGLGMSAGLAPDLADFVLCSVASHHSTPAPGNRQAPSPAPQCPFCFLAAQSAGLSATAGEAPTIPAYAGLAVATLAQPSGDGIFVPQVRHRFGEARAPPAVSV